MRLTTAVKLFRLRVAQESFKLKLSMMRRARDRKTDRLKDKNR